MINSKKFIIANWKMNPSTTKEAELIFKNLSTYIKKPKNTEIIICPPYTFLSFYKKSATKGLKLGAQNVYSEKSGPFTGEISVSMLKDLKVEYVIVGHSERRALGETDAMVNSKIISILKSKITPILCIGESHRDHNGFYLSFLKEQLTKGLHNVPGTAIKNIIIAYEPVWAIGSGAKREATPAEFIEVKIFIKKVLSDLYNVKIANDVKIIYGGSVNPKNTKSFMVEGEADGLLIGRASLSPKKFYDIINLTFN